MICQTKQQLLNTHFNNIKSGSDPLFQCTIDMLSAKCYFWLTALPTQKQGFHFNKQEFQDVLWLRYRWELSRILSHCVWGTSFSAHHAMTCHHNCLTFICHNELKDLTAIWLHDVAIEPLLQSLNGETVVPASANSRDDAWVDIHARGFWGRQQGAFFHIRVFHPNAPSYRWTQCPITPTILAPTGCSFTLVCKHKEHDLN